MTALATVQQAIDLAESAPTNATRLSMLLDAASAAVVRYTGQEFARSTTTTRLQVKRGRVRLPQRPVNAVSGVVTPAGVALAEGYTWSFDGIETLWVADQVWEGLYVPVGIPRDLVDVTYDHGYDEIPPDVVAVVAGAALRAYGSPPEEGGVTGETISNYSYQRGSVAAAGPVGLLAEEKRALDVFRRPGGSILLGR